MTPSLILAVDATAGPGTVALAGDRGEIAAFAAVSGPGAAGRELLPLALGLLEPHGGLDAVAAVACGGGPGSFTGLRIAAALQKGLAFARGFPLYGVPSLAAAAFEATGGEPVSGTGCVALLDAHRGDVYADFFPPGHLWSGAGALTGAWGGWPIPRAEAAARIVALAGPVIVCGRPELAGDLAVTTPESRLPAPGLPTARGAAQLCYRLRLEGRPPDGLGFEPRYQRKSEAELNFEAGATPAGFKGGALPPRTRPP